MRYVIVVIILAVAVSWGMNSVPKEHQKMMFETPGCLHEVRPLSEACPRPRRSIAVFGYEPSCGEVGDKTRSAVFV